MVVADIVCGRYRRFPINTPAWVCCRKWTLEGERFLFINLEHLEASSLQHVVHRCHLCRCLLCRQRAAMTVDQRQSTVTGRGQTSTGRSSTLPAISLERRRLGPSSLGEFREPVTTFSCQAHVSFQLHGVNKRTTIFVYFGQLSSLSWSPSTLSYKADFFSVDVLYNVVSIFRDNWTCYIIIRCMTVRVRHS